jgi:4-hydroxybenzoyl-CoA thioesterase
MLTNTIRVPIEWGHCDPARIVFYPNYFIWFDHATRHLFDRAGMGYETMVETYGTVGMPIVDAHAEFLLPSRFGDTIEVTSHIGEWRRKTLVVNHEITNAGETTVRGHEVRIWASTHPDDPARLVTSDIPPEFRALFEGGSSH